MDRELQKIEYSTTNKELQEMLKKYPDSATFLFYSDEIMVYDEQENELGTIIIDND